MLKKVIHLNGILKSCIQLPLGKILFINTLSERRTTFISVDADLKTGDFIWSLY